MIIKRIFIFLLMLGSLVSCTAVKSTYNSFGSSMSAYFSTPRTVENKITDPYDPEVELSVPATVKAYLPELPREYLDPAAPP